MLIPRFPVVTLLGQPLLASEEGVVQIPLFLEDYLEENFDTWKDDSEEIPDGITLEAYGNQSFQKMEAFKEAVATRLMSVAFARHEHQPLRPVEELLQEASGFPEVPEVPGAVVITYANHPINGRAFRAVAPAGTWWWYDVADGSNEKVIIRAKQALRLHEERVRHNSK